MGRSEGVLVVTAPRLPIEHVYTSDHVRIDYDEHGVEIGWTCVPESPDRAGPWKIFDSSPDSKTGWRCISLRGGLVA
jgi:hypothetical protein